MVFKKSLYILLDPNFSVYGFEEPGTDGMYHMCVYMGREDEILRGSDRGSYKWALSSPRGFKNEL